MMRSIKKGIFLDKEVVRQVKSLEEKRVSNLALNREHVEEKKIITTSARNCTIVPEFIGHIFLIHNGKKRFRITIISEMIGHKLGEFAPTRHFKEHTFVTKRSRQKVRQ